MGRARKRGLRRKLAGDRKCCRRRSLRRQAGGAADRDAARHLDLQCDFFGTGLIDSNAFSGARRVIDVSGDGPNNTGPPVTPARNDAVSRGIIINGLAILIRPSVSTGPLDQYYAECVIGGPGSFVLPVHEPEDFAIAIRQKLILEVSGLTPEPALRLAAGEAAADCMIGEKLRPGFLDRVYPELDR